MNNKNEYLKVNDIVFALLKEALFGLRCENIATIQDEELWKKVFCELQQQTVLGLTTRVIYNYDSIPEELKKKWNEQGLIIIKNYVQKAYVQQEVCKILQDRGIEVAVIKGMASAIYYPIAELREMGDIDLLVRPEDYETARHVMRRNGYLMIGEEDEPYHTVYRLNNIIIELHRSPSGIHRYQKGQNIREYILYGLDRIDINERGRYRFPILPWKQNGMELLWHIYQHLYNGLGLRHIIDWMMFVNDILDDQHMEEFMPDLCSCGLERLAIVVTKMCQKYLGLPQENITWCEIEDDSICDDLMNYIMEQGNFGIKVTNEKVAKAISGHSSLNVMYSKLQEFGKKKWNLLKKLPALEPFAFIYAGLTILVFNYKGKGKTRRVIRDVRLTRKRIRLFSNLRSQAKKDNIQTLIAFLKRW